MPRPDRSRVALIESAAVLFRRQGYAATGINQILATADVKAGSLYHHFPDGKAELAAAVVDGVGGDIARLLRTAVADRLIGDGWPDDRAAQTAQSVIALIEGALILSRIAGDRSALDAAKVGARTLLSAQN